MKPLYRYLAAAALGAGALFSGYRMLQLDQFGQLWGHLPLVFFLCAWLAIALLWLPRACREPGRWRRIGLSTLSGLLLSAGFPPSLLTPLMFVGFVPLLMAGAELDEHPGPGKREWFALTYHSFVLWNILTTFWVANSALMAGLLAMTINAGFMTVPWLLYRRSQRYIPRLAGLALIAFWISFEYIHLRWDLTWPWLTLGNAFAEHPSWVQWYEYTGVFGGSLWILLANLLIFQIWQRYRQPGQGVPPVRWLALAACLLAPLGGSLVRYYTFESHTTTGPTEIVVVQPNFEPHYEKFNVPDDRQLERFLHLADSAVTPQTRVLVFPETSFGPLRDRELGKDRLTRKLQQYVDQHPQLELIAGLSVYHLFANDEPRTPYVRSRVRTPGDTLFWESYNAAVQFVPGRDTVPIYRKSKLVPGAEFLPYRRIFFFLEPLVNKLDGSIAGLGVQPSRSVFTDANGIGYAPVICYESVFGEYHTGYIRAGAQVGLIMTNDGWWDNTAGHKQHLRYASLRAIETRRPFARAANTGISAFIDQRGDIHQPTAYNEAVAVRGTVLPNDRITFYVRWGDLIGRLALFTAIVLLLNNFVKGRLRKGGASE